MPTSAQSVVLHGHVAGAGRVVTHEDGAQPDLHPLGRQASDAVRHLGPDPGRQQLPVEHDAVIGRTSRRALPDAVGRRSHQCRKCRSPVMTIARPTASAAATTSPSRTEPPGWMTAATPARAEHLEAVGEREEGVAGRGAAPSPLPGLGHGDLGRHDPGLLAGPHPDGLAVGDHTMALDVVRPQTRQAKHEVPPLRLGRRRPW